AGHRERVAAIEVDLAGHRRSLVERDELAEELQAELGAHREVVAELQLEGDNLRGNMGALEDAVAAYQGHQSELEGALGTAHDDARAIQDELRGALAEIKRLAGEVAARDGVIGEQAAALDDRWGNLKRALGRRKPGADEEGSEAGAG
ncbi:MAG: hypothetical protein QF615_03195, partial [Planctomycetota bacterium]|nr:hypothetical protein [Planctomycetota bacterium]